jgi:hypothetical protein
LGRKRLAPEESARRAEARAEAKAVRRKANQQAHRAGLAVVQQQRYELRMKLYEQIAKENGLPNGQILATTLTEISSTLRAGGRYDFEAKGPAIARSLEAIVARGQARLEDPALARVVLEPSIKVMQLAAEALLARAYPIGQPLNAAGPVRVEILLAAPPAHASSGGAGALPANGLGAQAGLLPAGGVAIRLAGDRRQHS